MDAIKVFFKNNWLLAVLIVLVAILIVGQRLNFRFAGGTGYEAPLYADVLDLQGSGTVNHNGSNRPLVVADKIARGEIITTGSGGYIVLGFGLARISLDENSSVTVAENDANGIELNLSAGRLVVNSHEPISGLPIKIKTYQAESTIDHGAMSVINYDFLWQADVWPLNTTATIVTPKDGTIFSPTALQISTDGSGKTIAMAADFTHGPSAAFYAWVQKFDAFE